MNTFTQPYRDINKINASLGRVSDNSVIPMVLIISLRFIVTQADTVTEVNLSGAILDILWLS